MDSSAQAICERRWIFRFKNNIHQIAVLWGSSLNNYWAFWIDLIEIFYHMCRLRRPFDSCVFHTGFDFLWAMPINIGHKSDDNDNKTQNSVAP